MGKRIIFTSNAQFALTPAASDKPAMLAGYPLVWNVLSTDRGGYRVRLLPGSATFATPTHALFHHQYTQLLGTTENGSLRIMPDDFGVKVEIDLPDTTPGRDTETLVAGKYISGMSFAMIDGPDGETVTEGGLTILNATRYIVDEVTITPIPAFTQTSIGVAEPPDGYAARSAQARRLERLKLNLHQLPPERIVRPAEALCRQGR